MRLLNVRLDADAARHAAELRRAGVQLSRIVRTAIRVAHAEHVGIRGSRRPAKEVMARIYAEHPDPPDWRPRRLNLRDRRSVRRAISRRLRARRS